MNHNDRNNRMFRNTASGSEFIGTDWQQCVCVRVLCACVGVCVLCVRPCVRATKSGDPGHLSG